MNLFLRETWELFYWAMFCPSKLQQRMNNLAPYKNSKYIPRRDMKSSEILFPNNISSCFNFRFFAQYLLLLVCLSLPLIINITIQGRPIDWLQIPIVLLTAYYVNSFGFLSIGLPVPLIWLMVYRQEPYYWLTGLNEALNILPPLSQIAVGLITGTVLLIIINVLAFVFLQRNSLFLHRTILFIGGIVSFCFGSWLATENWLFVLLASVWYAFSFSMFKDKDDVTTLLACCVAFVVTAGMIGGIVFVEIGGVVGGIASYMVGGMAGLMSFQLSLDLEFKVIGVVVRVMVGVLVGFVMGVLVGVVVPQIWGVITLPLTLFILVCILVAFSLASKESKSLISIITAVYLSIIVNLGFNSLLTIPITLIFYYRLFPDYLLSTPISLFPSLPFLKRFSLKPLQTLKLLPPHTTELLWLPLPNHDRILEAAFRSNVSAAMETFKKMQALPLPGFQNTIKQALPQIIAHQLTTVKTLAELVSITKPEHPLLPLMVPTFYQSDSEQENAPQPEISPHIKPEISTIFPRLQGVARDVEAALEASNAALRERGLERVLDRLARLSMQLPGLGLKPPEIKRWQPVITRWQRVIELELEEQKKQSQREQLNPFQFGNPVRLNRDRLSLKLFDELRHLIQHYEQLGFLFSGVKTLDEIGPHWSSYFISVVPIEMLYLEPEEARELLINPDPEFTLRYDQGIVQEVLKLTRCQPYLLQLLGAAMVTQANLYHTDTITPELLKAAIEDGFINGEPYFTNIWTEFTGESEPEILAGQNLLLNLAKGEQPNNNRDEISEKALQYMLRHHIIEQIDSQYDFEILLVKMWVKQRAIA